MKRGFMPWPTADELVEAQRRGVDIDKIYPPPILIEDCNMVILHDDLICLQESELKPEIVTAIVNESAKRRKKLKPLQRETNEALLLIHELLDVFRIKYFDELSATAAWCKIVDGEFKSDLIKSVPETKGSITLSDGKKLNKADFLEKYRKRFNFE